MVKNQQLKFFYQDRTFFHFNQDIKKLSQDKHFYWAIRAVLMLVALIGIIIGIYWQKIPIQIPFFYSQSWGIDQLTTKKSLWWFYGAIIIISLINVIIISWLRTKKNIIAQIYLWVTIIILLMALINLIKIFTILSVW